MRGIRAETVFGDNQVEMRVILTQFGDQAFGGIAFTIIFARAILLDNRLRHQRYDFALIGMDERSTQHLMGIGHGAVSVVFFETRLTMNLVGGKIARAIKG